MMRFRTSLRVLGLLTSVLAGATSASAQSAENVAVVVNDNSQASQQIADYYVKKRAIPASNIIRIKTSTDDQIERPAYVATIEQPIQAALVREELQDRVLYIVLTKGVPLRIRGTDGSNGTVSSVDSELAVLYRRMIGAPVPVAGRVDNPYFLGEREIKDAKLFTHRDFDVYLVSRLDAFTVQEALALIDRGAAPANEGTVVLDQQDKLVNRTGEDWLEKAAARLTAAGQSSRVMLETTVQGVRNVDKVFGYYSWGSNDPRNRERKYGLGFVPGALAATFVSTDARTFTEPPAAWKPNGDWNDKSGLYAGSPQTLIGDLIREGVTGVAGHVAEPFLQSTIHPEILFPAYFAGFNLVESFYLAMPHVSWQTVVVGDPLVTAFPRKALTRADIEEPVDAETLLPGLLSKRRLAFAAAAVPNVPERAVKSALRAETLLVKRDQAGAVTAFEEATRLAPNFSGAHFQLALLLDQKGERSAAAEHYRAVVEQQPRNAIALNNLAYILATVEKKPAEALPFANRALALAPQSAVVMDTAGWVKHQLGDAAGALKLLTAASKAAPMNAEIHLHLAAASAASGARAAAEFELAEAVKLDPALDDSDDARAVRAQIARLPRPN